MCYSFNLDETLYPIITLNQPTEPTYYALYNTRYTQKKPLVFSENLCVPK